MPGCHPRGCLAIFVAAIASVAAMSAIASSVRPVLTTTVWKTNQSWKKTNSYILFRVFTEVMVMSPLPIFWWAHQRQNSLLRTKMPESRKAFSRYEQPGPRDY